MTKNHCWQCKHSVFPHEAYPNGECVKGKRTVILKRTDACKLFESEIDLKLFDEGGKADGKDK